MPSFSWTPNVGPTNKPQFDSTVIEFGDGYSQRQSNGINAAKDVWSLSFSNRSAAEGLEIVSFLKARAGVESFDFIPPGETQSKKFVCKTDKWSYQINAGEKYTISAEFEEVFEP